MKMKVFSFLGLAALILAVGCSSGAEGEPEVATTFRINSIVSEAGTNEIAADMINADEGITADFVTVTVGNNQKNPGATPSTLNDVIVNRYTVTFTRSDGGTVFEGFEGGLSQLVEVNETASFNIVVVRLAEKTSGALAGWRAPVLDMDARITLYGRTGSGDIVSASATIKVAPGNYGDDTGNLAPVIGSFIADKSEGVDGDNVTLSWYIGGGVNQIILNPGSIELNPWDYYPYGSYTITDVDFPQTFTLMVGGLDGFATEEVKVEQSTGAGNAPTINVFSAQPATIGSGESAVLSWNISNATSAVVYPELGAVDPTAGEVNVSPEFTTTYTIVAQNGEGLSTDTVNVTVQNADPEIIYFLGNVDEVASGEVVHLTWAVQGEYERLELFPFYVEDDDILDVTGTSSVVTEAIIEDTTFVLTAYGAGSVVNKTFEVSVLDPVQSAVSLNMMPASDGQLSWNVMDTDFRNQAYQFHVVDGDPMLFSSRRGVIENGMGEIQTALTPLEKKDGYSVVQLSMFGENGSVTNDYRLVRADGRCLDAGIQAESSWNTAKRAGTLKLELSDQIADQLLTIRSVSGETELLGRVPGGTWTSLKTGLQLPSGSSRIVLEVKDVDDQLLADHSALVIMGQGADGSLAGDIVQLHLN